MKTSDFFTPLYEVGYGRGPSKSEKGKSTWSAPQGYGREKSMAGMDYATRVQRGKKMEAEIYRKLESIGVKVEPTTREADIKQGIDFYVTYGENRWSAQAKQREVGDDIIFEVYKFWEGPRTPPNGRDFRGQAQVYIAVDTKGNGFLVPTSKLKTVAKEYVDKFGMESGNYQGAQFKVTQDRRSGDTKLMAFFPPSKYGRKIF